jgi:REP element-mobilizing transposase RayT
MVFPQAILESSILAANSMDMVRIYLHAVIYVADGKRPFDESLSNEAAAFTKTVLHYKGLHCESVCVLPDHVHLLIHVPMGAEVERGLTTLRYWLSDYVERHSSQPSFEWQERMWIVSKSPCDVSAMEKYFRRQHDYHATHTIEEEWADMMDLEEIEN